MKKVSIKAVIIQLIGMLIIVVLFYHFAYPRIFIASIKNKIMVAIIQVQLLLINLKNVKDVIMMVKIVNQ